MENTTAIWRGDDALPYGASVTLLARDDSNEHEVPARTPCWIRWIPDEGFSPRYRSCDLADLEIDESMDSCPVDTDYDRTRELPIAPTAIHHAGTGWAHYFDCHIPDRAIEHFVMIGGVLHYLMQDGKPSKGFNEVQAWLCEQGGKRWATLEMPLYVREGVTVTPLYHPFRDTAAEEGDHG
ncbi:hypothetical protein [Novosphingobium guangzhouense]|uniref:Uncharacterized protein n=1 Tax=Novosphingobium guangzhouense TaxID=1850347 RepID=A0A2K2FWF9_9SPHN|nr:hypothetical protein [Novosphingobium guangzhouense]PNU03121.1 hypothetical protein A8V01_24875 [Novosphingobium guangzhouense]